MKRLPEQAPSRTSTLGQIGKKTNQRTVGQTAKRRAGRSKSSRWLGAPFRRLARLSYGATVKDNALIHAENMCALQSLQETFAGRVRCIYIDPPYNNQERYRHYLDNQGHEEWLRAITSRLELLRPLLCQNGSLWISIDDREMHYLKVAADQVLGRRNFVSTIVWQQRTTRENRVRFSQTTTSICSFTQSTHNNSRRFAIHYLPEPNNWRDTRTLTLIPVDRGSQFRRTPKTATRCRRSTMRSSRLTAVSITPLMADAGYTRSPRFRKRLRQATSGSARTGTGCHGSRDS